MQAMMPEERAELPPPAGSRYLMELVLHRIDPSRLEPGPPAPPGVTGDQEDGIALIRNEMAQRLRKNLHEFMTLNPDNIFLLTHDQDRTLENLGLPESAREAVRSLCCLKYATGWHQTRDRLEIIASMPGTPRDGMPDWTRWWLENAGSRLGVHEHPGSETRPEPARETLAAVVAAIAREAWPNLPRVERIAQHILELNRTDQRGRKKKQPEAPRLSQAWSLIQKLNGLARGIGLDVHRTRDRWPGTPEALLAELRRTEPGFRQDMGTLGRIEELREVVRQNSLGRACTNGNGLWHDADAHDGWRISGGMGPEPIHTGLEEGGPPADWAELSLAEVNLMRESAPAHPAGVWMHQGVRPQDRNAAIIALANGITPARAREYLAGRLEDVRGETPEACPQASRCRSWCGRLQAEGAISFPLTDDGGYRDCRYFRFLEDHGELEPEQRERYAEAEAEAELAGRRKKSGKRGRKQGQTKDGETGQDEDPGRGIRRRGEPEGGSGAGGWKAHR